MTKETTKYFEYLWRYPIFIDLFNQDSSLSEFSQSLSTIENEINKKHDISTDFESDEEFFGRSDVMLNILSEIETEIERKESKKKYLYPTFNFNIDKINNHVFKDIDNNTKRIDYLNYILSVYPDYINLRYSIMESHFNKFNTKKNPGNNIFGLQKMILSKLPDDMIDINLPKPPLHFHIRIHNILEYLQKQLELKLKSVKLKKGNQEISRATQNDGKENKIEQIDISAIVKTTLNEAINKHYRNKEYNDEDFLTAKQVMEYLGICRATYERRNETGEIRKEYINNKPGVYFKNIKDLRRKVKR